MVTKIFPIVCNPRNYAKWFFVNLIIFIGKVLQFAKPKTSKLKKTRVLLVQLCYIGDVIFITPFIECVKKSFPELIIDVWINKGTIDILKYNPHISTIYQDCAPQIRYNSISLFVKRILLNFKNIQNIWKADYDFAIDFSGFLDSALFVMLASKKHTIGIIPTSEKNLNKAYFSVVQRVLDRKTISQINLEPIKYFKVDCKCEFTMKVYLSEKEIFWAENYLKNYQGKKVVLAPFAGWINKEWGVERFIKLAEMISKNDDISCFVIGSQTDQNKIKQSLNINSRIVNCLGKTNILQSAVLIYKCDLFIGLDSSMAKIAESYNKKSILIYGGTNPKYSAPIENDTFKIKYSEIGCSPKPGNEYCGDGNITYKCKNNYACMEAISVDDIFETAINLLQEVNQIK